MTARAELIQKSIELLQGWAGGAAGSPLPAGVGPSIDFNTLGLMGHSRGGEAVATYAERAEDGVAGIVPSVAIPLASVNFNRPTLNSVSSATITPYCDGDVSDLSSVHFFDDDRHSATADRYWVAIDGANHNFFNTVWSPESGQPGSSDDAGGVQSIEGDAPCKPQSPWRLSEATQRDVGLRWMTTVFEASLHGSIAHRQMLEATQPVPGVDTARSHINWQPGADRRNLINSFDRSARLAAGESGGPVAIGAGLAGATCGSQTAALVTCRDVLPGTGLTEAPEYTGVMEPHATQRFVAATSSVLPYTALGVARMRWGTPAPLPPTTTTTWPAIDLPLDTVPGAPTPENTTDAATAAATPTATTDPTIAATSSATPGDHMLVQEIPAAQRSVGDADSIRLRIATVPDRYNKTDVQTATVTIADGASASVTLNIADLDPIVLRTPPLAFLTEDKGFDESFRHMLVQQLRIPVATLSAQGLDTTDLRSIALGFDQASGDIVTGDWLYATETQTPRPPATTTTTTTSAPLTTMAPAPTVTPVPVRFTG